MCCWSAESRRNIRGKASDIFMVDKRNKNSQVDTSHKINIKVVILCAFEWGYFCRRDSSNWN